MRSKRRGEEAAAPVAVANRPREARPALERVKIEVPRLVAGTRKRRRWPKRLHRAVKAPVVPPPRFALQLLRAGRCLLLVELPTGEALPDP